MALEITGDTKCEMTFVLLSSFPLVLALKKKYSK